LPALLSAISAQERLREAVFFVALLLVAVFLAGARLLAVFFAGALLVAVFFVALPALLVPLLLRPGGGGMFAPDRRASLKPIAIACFGFFTFRPLPPDSNS